MNYPRLIKEEFCNQYASGRIYGEGLTEEGSPISYEFSGYCNYQNSSKTIYTKEQKIVEIIGKCYFDGDILKDIENITAGEILINGSKLGIVKGSKCRNFDNTINYTVLEVK